MKSLSPIRGSNWRARKSSRRATVFRPAWPTISKSSPRRMNWRAPTTIRSAHSIATTRPAPAWRMPRARWRRCMPGKQEPRRPSTPTDFQVREITWHRGVSPWVIAMTVMLAAFMEVLDTSVATVALPHIAGSLSASMDESTWMLTSFLVANAIILPMGGWFSMLMGRKRFYMTCVALFTVSSFLCGIAPSLGALIFFRVLQGIGGGALQPVSQAILVESFPREKQGMAMAVYAMGVVVAPVICPTLCVCITDNYTWRCIFLINIPVGILSLVLTSMLIFDPPFLKRRAWGSFKIDYAGFGLLALGLGALEVVLDEGQKEDWFSSHFIVAFAAITVICLVGVVIWELRQKEPIIDFRVLKDRNYALATSAMLV